MSRFGYIYKTTNLINGKIYIGQHRYSKKGIDKSYYGSGKLLLKAIEKYGIENFKCEIIQDAESKEDLDKKEIKWIDFYRKLNYEMYNIVDGGTGGDTNGGKTFSKEWRERISKGQKGRKATEETKRKLSISHLGQKPWNKGIPISEEQKKKISQANKGKACWCKGIKWTEEQKQNMSKIKKEFYKEHPEYLEKMSKAHLGQKSWSKGQTKETNPSLMSNSLKQSIKVKCIELDKIFISMREASKAVGATPRTNMYGS